VINEKNLKTLWRLPAIIKELGLKKIIFEYERRYTGNDVVKSSRTMGGFGFADLKLSKSAKPKYSLAELRKNIEKMEKEAVKSAVEVGYLPVYFKKEMGNMYRRSLRKKYKCTCDYLDKTRIDPVGNYIHCFALRKPLGNVLVSSLEETWNSRQYINFRKRILKNNLLPICETCWCLLPVAKIKGISDKI
jgi:radical SAM protein with 4Fe4S-binding SPASM domain